MPAKAKEANTLRTTLRDLIGARIGFTVHYPSKNSMVITADKGLTNAQLKVVVEHGGSIGPGGAIMILVPELGTYDG